MTQQVHNGRLRILSGPYVNDTVNYRFVSNNASVRDKPVLVVQAMLWKMITKIATPHNINTTVETDKIWKGERHSLPPWKTPLQRQVERVISINIKQMMICHQCHRTCQHHWRLYHVHKNSVMTNSLLCMCWERQCHVVPVVMIWLVLEVDLKKVKQMKRINRHHRKLPLPLAPLLFRQTKRLLRWTRKKGEDPTVGKTTRRMTKMKAW
mmetsp:Transcript_28515/g.40068  ORF Transcript_28515/g.40068 Transcript_28515/m.40068 type:complete len:209 (+) Transcript_28515:1502-2128(+)